VSRFGDVAPLGYDRITLTTQVHQDGVPPAFLSPGFKGGKPIVTWAGPDGTQRPLLVELSFLQCNRCGAVVIGELMGGVSTHNDWHGKLVAPPTVVTAAHGPAGEECPPSCALPGPHGSLSSGG